MNKPMIVIRKKMTLTEKEQNDVLLGNIEEKKTKTYKSAKLWFEERVQVYSQIGKLSITETKLWFDANEYAVKMQFVIESIDKEKYEKLSKDIDKHFHTLNQDMDILFKELTMQMDKAFKKINPTIDKIFEEFDELFTNIFGKHKKKKEK